MKLTVAILLLLSYTTLCHARIYQTKNSQQNVPTLSGTWELDRSRSRFNKRSKISRVGTITLTITHTEPRIGITQRTNLDGEEKTKEFLYYTDGRGEVNPANNQYLSFYNGVENPKAKSPLKIESRSQWKGTRLKVRYAILIPVPGNSRMSRLDVEEEWVVSPDGKTLTQTTSFKGLRDGALEMRVKPGKPQRVFNKVS